MKRKNALLETLHLVMLGGFALAQPLYQVLSDSPAFFVVRRSQALDLWLLVIVLSLAIPGAVAVLPRIVGWVSQRAEKGAYGLVMASWLVLTTLPILKRHSQFGDGALLASAVAIALVLTALYSWQQAIRTFASFLLPAALIFPLLFLLDPAIRRVLSPPQPRAVEEVFVARSTPVFLLVFDALPTTSLMDAEGNIDPLRYPALARLAEQGSWYRRAVAASDYTAYAVPSILTGSYTDRSRLPSLIDYPDNLFTLVGSSYRVRAWEPVTQLCPSSVCGGGALTLGDRLVSLGRDLSVVYRHQVIPPGMARELPPIAQRWKDFAADAEQAGPQRQQQKLADFASFLASIDAQQPRSLYFLHLVLPHAPFQFLPEGQLYVEHQEQPTIEWPLDPWPSALAYQRHLLQLGFVDQLVGRLLSHLDRLGLYDSALIAVTADHGVSFRPGEKRRRLTAGNQTDVLPVPLIVKRPGQRSGGIDDRRASVIDLLPTVADELGIDLPWSVDGRSLRGADDPQRPLFSLAEELEEIPAVVLAGSLTTLGRKLSLFGDGRQAVFPQPRLASHLIGKAARRRVLVEAGEAQVLAAVEQAELYDQVEPSAAFVPALIGGWARLPPESPPVTLAVAVGGVVRAVTRTTARQGSGGLASWQAVVEPNSFRSGHNRIDLYLLSDDNRHLIPISAGAGENPFVGVRLGIEPFAEIDQQGFHKIEEIAGLPVRWTRGRAVLRIPLSGERKPARMQIDLLQVAPAGSAVEILVEGKSLFSGHVEKGPWSRTFDLPRLRHQQMAIQFRSDTFVPREALDDNQDPRTLGVALAGVWLLGDSEEEAGTD